MLDVVGLVVLNHGVNENLQGDFMHLMEAYFYSACCDLTEGVPDSSRYSIMWMEYEPQHFQSEGGIYGGMLTECGQPPPNSDDKPGA